MARRNDASPAMLAPSLLEASERAPRGGHACTQGGNPAPWPNRGGRQKAATPSRSKQGRWRGASPKSSKRLPVSESATRDDMSDTRCATTSDRTRNELTADAVCIRMLLWPNTHTFWPPSPGAVPTNAPRLPPLPSCPPHQPAQGAAARRSRRRHPAGHPNARPARPAPTSELTFWAAAVQESAGLACNCRIACRGVADPKIGEGVARGIARS